MTPFFVRLLLRMAIGVGPAAVVLMMVVSSLAVASVPDGVDAESARLMAEGRWEAAYERLHAVWERGTVVPAALLARISGRSGEAALAAGRWVDAAARFDRGLRFAPGDPALLTGLGTALLKQALYDPAETAFADALAIDPENPTALIGLGEIAYLTDRTEAAADYFRRALSVRPDDPTLTAKVERLERQIAASGGLDTVADHRFTVRFDGQRSPALKTRVMDALTDAWFEVGQAMGAWPSRPIAVTLLTREAFFDITGSPRWAGGVYEGQIKIPVAGYDPETLTAVLQHEYVHALVFDLSAGRCPWWLNEGLAQHLSDPPAVIERKLARAWDRIDAGRVPPLSALPDTLSGGRNAGMDAYALSLSATRFLIESVGIFSLGDLLISLGSGESLDAALAYVGADPPEALEGAWITSVRRSPRPGSR